MIYIEFVDTTLPIELQGNYKVVVGINNDSNIDIELYPVLRGESGDPGYTARRHEFTSSTSYCATAAVGTLDTSPTWSISKIVVASAGTCAVTFTIGAWSVRHSLTYT